MFDKLRERTGKQFVRKYSYGSAISTSSLFQAGTTVGERRRLGPKTVEWDGTNWIDLGFFEFDAEQYEPLISNNAAPSAASVGAEASSTLTQQPTSMNLPGGDPTNLKQVASGFLASDRGEDTSALTGDAAKGANMQVNMLQNAQDHTVSVEKQLKALANAERAANFAEGFGGTADGTIGSAIGNFTSGNWKTGLVDTAVAGMKAVDNLAMGDKNFGAQSEAIDSAVHGVSGALMKSGNPYAMAAGAALEGANFLTKAGGQTVQGFDVDINSSGYGLMGHKASSSSRDFGAMIGLGGIFNQGKMQAKLAKRNQEAQMAMNAANIANEQAFEQEARANSIQNTIMNNQMALAGGLDTSLLGG